MARNVVPQMGAYGWCEDDDPKLDTLLAHAYTCNFSQSQIFYGSVCSISKIFQENRANPAALAARLSEAFTTYLSKFFETVDVKATVDNPDETVAVIRMKIGYVSKGKQKTALRALQPSGGIFQHVVRVLNDGTD